jgi:hypothetical protein
MNAAVYRYVFEPGISIEDAEAALLLAILAAEALHGEAQVRLDAGHYFDAEQRRCVINADTAVGQDVSRLFVSFLAREFGPESFRTERIAAGELAGAIGS